nr:hypothetical protein [uncultured Peptostreptococcus sp.]
MDKKQISKRYLSLLLALIMLIGTLPQNIFAETFTTQVNGNTVVNTTDWTIDEKKEAEMSYWRLSDVNELTVVANAEGLKTPSINYIGTYINADGRTVIRVSYRVFQNLASDVWHKALFKFDKDLYNLIDFNNTGTGMYKGVIDGGFHDSATYSKISSFADCVSSYSGAVHVKEQSLTNNGNKVGGSARLEIPIDLVLKADKTVNDIKGQPHIQMRITNKDYSQVFCVAGTDKSSTQNVIFTPYNSYTFMTYIPSANNNADVDTVSDYNMDKQFYSANSYAKYNEAGGYLDVFHKQSKLASGDNIGGESFAFRQVFNEKFAEVLKPQDKSGTVAEVFPANQQGEMWATSKPIKITETDLNTSENSGLNPGFTGIQVASNAKGNIGTKFAGLKTVLTTAKPQESFLNSSTTELNSGLPTITRYYVDRDKMAAKGLTADDLAAFDFYSTIILDSTKNLIEYTATNNTGADIVIPANSQIGLTYFNGPTPTPNTELDKYSLTFGDGPYKIELRSNFKHVGTLGNKNVGLQYEYNLIPGMTIKAGEKITFRTMKYNTKNPPSKVTLTLPSTHGNKTIELSPGTGGPEKTTPRRLNYITTYAGGSATQTNLPPDVDEIFTDSTNITGRTRYKLAKMRLYYPVNTDAKDFEFTIDDLSQTKVVVNGKEFHGYTFTTDKKSGIYTKNGVAETTAKPFAMPTLKKDMPIDATNRDELKASVASDKVTEQVQAKVTFKPGGPLGDDVSYDKIAPLNKDYLYTYDEASKKYISNIAYKANGFGELDDKGNVVAGTLANIKVDDANVITVDGEKMINYINHDGKTYDTSDANQKEALKKRQWPEVKGNDGSKFINGKVLIGWTTKKLVDDANGTAAQKYFKLVEENKVVDELTDWTSAKNEAYVYNSKSPMDEAITVYGVWGEPAIRLHSNFDKDEATTGTQEDVETQVLEKAVIDQLKTNDDPTTIDATLKSVYDKNEFKRDGYSLVGFSRTADASEPDANVTGSGLTADNYLRDGDTFKLADTAHNYTFDATKGLDLYAVWKEDFTIKAKKAWLDKNGTALTPKKENVDALKFALIGRPAVGTFGSEVVVQGATYHPIKGTIKNFTGTDLTWGEGPEGKLKGYDTKGRRMSYLIVELTNAEQEAAFNAGSTNWSDYGIKITEADIANHIYGHKDQVISFKNGTDVDTFTGATTRLHKTATNPDGVNPHGSGTTPKVGYFETTGYVINVANKEVVVPYPTIEQGYTGDTTITVNPPEKMVDKITVTLPDNTTAIFKKNAAGTGYVTTGEGNTKATLAVTDGKLVITPATPLAKDQVVKAKAETDVAGQNIQSEEVSMKVIDRKVSNKPEALKQEKYDESGNVPILPISFKVPDNITDKPVPGTVYTVVTVDAGGNETPTTHKYTIPADGAETIPGTRQTITVPKSELEGKKVIIKAQEPNKTATNSDPLDLDFTAPTVTPDARDERWRRWTDINVVLGEAADGPIILSYEENGTVTTKEYDTKEELSYDIARLSFNENVSDMTITATDKFGNRTVQPINYAPIGQTQIIVAPIRAGRNFVIVTAKEANTKVVVNVYAQGTLLDNYARDKYFDFIGPDKPTPKATVELTFDQANKRQRMRIKDTDGNAYKLQKGDVIDIVGTIGKKGPEYKITNPFTEIVK